MSNILKSLIEKVNASKAKAVNDLKTIEAGFISHLTLYLGTNWHPLAAGGILGLIVGALMGHYA